MLAAAIQKSVLEWLQLTPELLPARAKPAVAPLLEALPVTEAAFVDSTVAAPVAAIEEAPVAVISSQTVLPGTPMSFLLAPSAPAGEGHLWQQVIAKSYPADGRAYASVESGGTQRAVLSEMTGYLTTWLQPVRSPSA